MGIKEMILDLKVSVERLEEETKENNINKKKKELGTSDGSYYKMKEKMEEVEVMNNLGGGSNDKS